MTAAVTVYNFKGLYIYFLIDLFLMVLMVLLLAACKCALYVSKKSAQKMKLLFGGKSLQSLIFIFLFYFFIFLELANVGNDGNRKHVK